MSRLTRILQATVVMYAMLLTLAPPTRATTKDSPFEIDLKDLEKLKGTTPSKTRKSPPHAEPTLHKPASSPTGDGVVIHTVKPGDTLFKILMRDFGMSNNEAERLVPEVMRVNGLKSSTRLTIGQKLKIPTGKRSASASRSKSTAKHHHPKQMAAPSIVANPPASEPAAHTPTKTVAAAPEPSKPPVARPLPLTVHPITNTDPQQIVDKLLSSLGLPWSKDRVIEGTTGQGGDDHFSIKVDRYMELQGKRIVVTGSGQDPFAYTMLRLLEVAGYTVVRLDMQGGFASLTSQLLTKLDISFAAGLYRFIPPAGEGASRELTGFLVTLPLQPAKVFLTDTPLDALTGELLGRSRVEPVLPAGS